MRTHIVFILFSLVLSILPIICIVNSDSGYLAYDPYRGKIEFLGLPVQAAIIYYSDGYELILTITKYSLLGSHAYKIVYYFPLPSKPIYYNVLFINAEKIELDSNLGVDINKFKKILRHYMLPPSIYGGLIGGLTHREEEYRVLRLITGETYNLSLIEASEINIEIFNKTLHSLGYTGELPKGLKDIISHYRRLNWRYFIVGVAEVVNEVIVLQAYLFKTDKIVYPLYLDRLQSDLMLISLYITCDGEVKHVSSTGDLRLTWNGFNPNHIIVFHNVESIDNIMEFFEKLSSNIEEIYGDNVGIGLRQEDYNLFVIISLKGLAYSMDSRDLIEPKTIDNDVVLEVSGEITIDHRELFGLSQAYMLLIATIFSLGVPGLLTYSVLSIIYLSSYIQCYKLAIQIHNSLKIGILATLALTVIVLTLLLPYISLFIEFSVTILIPLILSLMLFNVYHILGYQLLRDHKRNFLLIEAIRSNYALFYLTFVIVTIWTFVFPPITENILFNMFMAIICISPFIVVIRSIRNFMKTIEDNSQKYSMWIAIITLMVIVDILIILYAAILTPK